MTNKPTQDQIKKLWEWCGLYKKKHPKGNWFMWHSPDGNYLGNSPLDLDLNNLFKYAVPKLQDKGQIVPLIALEHKGFDCMITAFAKGQIVTLWVKNQEDPALALFWAIWEVIKND